MDLHGHRGRGEDPHGEGARLPRPEVQGPPHLQGHPAPFQGQEGPGKVEEETLRSPSRARQEGPQGRLRVRPHPQEEGQGHRHMGPGLQGAVLKRVEVYQFEFHFPQLRLDEVIIAGGERRGLDGLGLKKVKVIQNGRNEVREFSVLLALATLALLVAPSHPLVYGAGAAVLAIQAVHTPSSGIGERAIRG